MVEGLFDKFDQQVAMGNRFQGIWDRQEAYNSRVMEEQIRSQSEWIQTYLLGMVSEVDEVLREIDWKHHRRTGKHVRLGPNVGMELADLTKYIISMWQIAGFEISDMLRYLEDKHIMLNELWEQEHREPVTNRFVILTDIDGTLADFKAGFLQWLSISEWRNRLPQVGDDSTLHMDLDYQWDFEQYQAAKDSFEAEGGYGRLPGIPWALASLQEAVMYHDAYVVAYTARPHSRFNRIWIDSWKWFQDRDLIPNELYMGGDDRIGYAIALRKAGNGVVLFEDNPDIVRRACNNHIPVVMPHQPYNLHLSANYGVWAVNGDNLPDWQGLKAASKT